ncbi:alpha/beta hydrolase [Paenibacillus sp. SYP-B3998]|uniref:Alpha/beta hydrolase n=2 Tax=Paenibacillus sp. SYP-B3998 TaxID=2678564 RepID=A0A6G3ZUW9_9BACL|nr:alpha/beta hydrolase [Paenibacillus sp. SYP-B3998]
MSEFTAETADTLYLEAEGVRFAYRSFGEQSDVPLVCCQRFRGTMDDWDPAVINGLARERRIILFDNAGVGLSSGESPNSMVGMANNAISFLEALGLTQVDLLGFSMGGSVAQAMTLLRPELVRRLILAGTGPGAGDGIQGGKPEVFQVAGKPINDSEDFMYLFFEPTETSLAAGRAYLKRLEGRQSPREPLVKPETVKAQLLAIVAWATGEGSYTRLSEIKQPVLVANGQNDIMVPTVNSFIMSQRLPNAQLIVYPDSGHGFLFQYPDLFVEHALLFIR